MKERSSFLTCLVLVLVLGCLAVFAGGAAAFGLPVRAERTFGPSKPGMRFSQRIYLSAQLLMQQDDLVRPADPQGTEKSFRIDPGDSPSRVAQRLEQSGLIRNAEAFTTYLVYSGLDTGIQAGSYRLSPLLTPVQVARLLQDATPAMVPFNVLPGWRLEEIAAALPTSGLEISPENFLKSASERPSGLAFLQELPADASLEGFLFPDTYELPRGISANEMVSRLAGRFQDRVSSNLQAGFQRQGLSLYQAVTLASMVQREAMVEEEMPQIASVFLNRMAQGMKLDSDPTVQYALGYNAAQKTWWTNPLSASDLQVGSPYNTYLSSGLPPGPIANPGLKALQAVSDPLQTPYYYFRAACDGSGRHVFSKTLQEHIARQCP